MISLPGLFKEEDIENMKEFIGLILEGAHEKTLTESYSQYG